MKQGIKSVLKSLGLYKGLYHFYISRERKKYEKIDVCHMEYQGTKLQFDTRDAYSKKWFYPRFGRGKIHEPGATKIFFDHVKDGDTVLTLEGI